MDDDERVIADLQEGRGIRFGMRGMMYRLWKRGGVWMFGEGRDEKPFAQEATAEGAVERYNAIMEEVTRGAVQALFAG